MAQQAGQGMQRTTQPASAALLRGGSHAHLPPGAPAFPASTGEDEDVGYKQLIKEGDVVLLDIVRRSGLAGKPAFGGAKSFVRAGPREHICWAPGEAVAAIVTCGGQCASMQLCFHHGQGSLACLLALTAAECRNHRAVWASVADTPLFLFPHFAAQVCVPV